MEVLSLNLLVTNDDIKTTLKKDKGPSACLTSWSYEDFTKKGDNYASIVTGVNVSYKQEEKDKTVRYVAKTNPCRDNSILEPYTRFLFHKEGSFYNELRDCLDKVICQTIGCRIGIPKCFVVKLPLQKEVIIMEDLRCRGFAMANRRVGLNQTQALLVICELARIHAASLLHKTETVSWATFVEEHSYLKQDRMNYDEKAGEKFSLMYSMILENTQEVLKKVGGYSTAIRWLSGVKECLMELYAEQLADNPVFNVICHGDCWTNNIMFRYNMEGNPVETKFVDLQMCRIASLATDLNYFLYSSLDRPVRTKYLSKFLSVYHETFTRVLEAGKMTVPFSLSELHQEFKAKNLIGAITAFTIIPATLMPEGEVLDYSDIKGGSFKDFMMMWRNKMLNMVDDNPLMRPRFIELFDELQEYGLIN